MKTVWIVSEGSPGHVSQSVGLACALDSLVPLQTITITGRATLRGWVRPIIRWLMGPHGRPLNDFLLHRIADIKIPSDAPLPDLIVSSGGKSVFVGKTLAERYKVPYIFIGERKPYPASWFHTVISPVPKEACDNSIEIELIPTPVTPDLIAQKGTTEKGLWCMIIGGSSRSRRFNENDWVAIAQGMNELAIKKNIRWLLTTSRRTGAETEKLLKKHIKPEILEDAIWWAEQPRRELYIFMARAELLFVTQDSVTMVTEAVSSGKPVVAIQPKRIHAQPEDFSVMYFERLERNKRITQTQSYNLGALELGVNQYALLDQLELNSISKQLLSRLPWSVSNGL